MTTGYTSFNSSPPSKTIRKRSHAKAGGLSAMFGCTYEGLALFRILLGTLLTAELILRFRFLHVFYTDEGTKPLRLLLPNIDGLYRLVCYHCHFGTLLQQQILLIIQVLVAICLAIGYQTKIAAILSFYMYTSLILRNTWLYFILDRYFYYLLFYSMFLPLDERWSLAAFTKSQQVGANTTESTSRKSIFVNPATVALKMLVFWIYLDAGWGKYMDPKEGWTYHADPLPALDTYARHTVPAQHLYGMVGPEGLRLMTPLVVWVEILCVPVALAGSYLGSVNIVRFAIVVICMMHIGISLCIRNSNLLGYVACCAWLVFLPLGWNNSERNDDNHNDRKNNSNSDTTAMSTASQSFRNRLASLVTLVMVSAMVGGNIWFETIATGCSTESLRLIWSTLLQNRWNVFIGAEEYVTWEIAPGRLQDGSVVDVWGRTDMVNWNMPGSGAPCTSTSRPGRWRSFPYLADLEGEDAEALWGYLCQEWDSMNGVSENNNQGRKLLRFNFFMLQADVLPNMAFSSTRKRLVHSHECATAAKNDLDGPHNETYHGEETSHAGQEL
mmetsp:Transcript_413/g.1040  ORF Transcript_413/g.1040 Transcript_413/m.1040 type:complete len:555 (-) Transcript_413:119-1783(-)